MKKKNKKYPYYVQIVGSKRLNNSLDTIYVMRANKNTQIKIIRTRDGDVYIEKENLKDKDFKESFIFIKIDKEMFKQQLETAFHHIMQTIIKEK